MRPTLLFLTVTALVSGCQRDRSHVVLPPEGLALDSTGSTPRHFLPESLVLLASVGGGSDGDTTFLDPYLITAWHDRVYLVETDQRVLAYDIAGLRLWSQGKDGSGPGEYRNIRDIKLGPDHRIWIHDPTTVRITRLDTTGRVTGFIPLDRVGHSEAMVPDAQGGASLLPPYADADILRIDSSGAVIGRDTVGWPGFHALENLSRQFRTALDPATGRWVMGFEYGNGWFAFDAARGSERRFYVEPTRFPPVIKEVMNGGQAIGTKLVRSEQSGADLSLSGDTVFVLFGGKEQRREKLDLYDWTSGHYLGSIALPGKVDYAAVSGEYVYTMASAAETPRLSIYRRVGTR